MRAREQCITPASPRQRARRIARTKLAAWVALLWLFGLRSAYADATRAHLSWTRPSQGMCPTGAMIERDVEELAGHRVFAAEAQADVWVRGGIEDGETGVHAWFEARTHDGEPVGTRELSGAPGECAALRRSLALVLTILLDRPTPHRAAPPGAAPPSPAPRRSAVRSRLPRAGASLGLLSGTLPRIAPGVGLSLAQPVLGTLHVRADGSYWLPQTSSNQAGIGASMSAVSGGLALCPEWTLGHSRWSIHACAGGQLGALLATPHDLARPAPARRLLAQVTVELGLSLRVLPRTTLFLSGGSTFALSRPEFFYDRDDGQSALLGRPALFGAIARLGMTIGAP